MKPHFPLILGCLLILSFPSLSFGQTLKPTLTHDLVSGIVKNEKAGGVKGVIEFLNPATDKKVAQAAVGEDGKFQILLPKKGSYYFLIRSGYFTYFFKDESHILETTTEPVEAEVELEFEVLQYSKGTSIILHDLNFGTNLFALTSSHKASLDFLAAFLKNHPQIKIQVAGHTDNQGSEADNKVLSKNRAESVRKYLVEEGGIAEDRVTSFGYGPSRPLTSNETAEGRAMNRRTSFIITEGEK